MYILHSRQPQSSNKNNYKYRTNIRLKASSKLGWLIISAPVLEITMTELGKTWKSYLGLFPLSDTSVYSLCVST